MKFICQLSGISCHVSGFTGAGMVPATAGYVHPAHFLPVSRIAAIAASFSASPSAFSPEDAQLLASCLLHLSGLSAPTAPIAPAQDHIISAKLPALASTVFRILGQSPAIQEKAFPHWNHSGSLENLGEVLAEWNGICDAAENSFREINRTERKNSLVSRYRALIASSKKLAAARATRVIASWAAIAGEFPLSQTTHPSDGHALSMSEYWQEIIVACATPGALLEFPEVDIADLIDHCYERISVSDFLAHDLFSLLGDAAEARKAYILGGAASSAGFSGAITARATRIILDDAMAALENDEQAIAALASLRDAAPASPPMRAEYANAKDFLIAKLAYASAQGASK